jgi:DNA-binding beta-propeller fold protein YncE
VDGFPSGVLSLVSAFLEYRSGPEAIGRERRGIGQKQISPLQRGTNVNQEDHMSRRRLLQVVGWPGILIVAVLILFPVASFGAPQESGYRVLRTVHLGGPGRWDYVTVDPAAKRIYIPRSTHVMVLDETTGKVIGDIPGLKGIHGVAVAPEFNRGFITGNKSENEGTIYVFDLKTLKVTSALKSTGVDTDSLHYDPLTKRVYVGNGDGNNITVVDAKTARVVGTLPLKGDPEASEPDGRGNTFVNISDKNQMLEYDSRTLAIKHRWTAGPCGHPVGLAMDTVHRRLFMACRGTSDTSPLLVVMNADNGKIVATEPIGIGADGAAYDPAVGMVYVTCRDSGDGKTGVTKVFHQDSPDKYRLVTNVKTIYGARTIALDPNTHHIFTIGTAENTPVPATAKDPHPRPRPVPSTFELLEIGK